MRSTGESRELEREPPGVFLVHHGGALPCQGTWPPASLPPHMLRPHAMPLTAAALTAAAAVLLLLLLLLLQLLLLLCFTMRQQSLSGGQ